ncbi:hypothetical protein E4U53_006728 [Claviceps sorghi]|nr:hypothetical protein E4U53_006728 [Claviceps sorghi]
MTSNHGPSRELLREEFARAAMAVSAGQWPVKDIVYTAIVGFVMLMACLEWLLWFAAFIYCFVKAYVKAEHWSIRVLCLLIGSAFALLRHVDLGPFALPGDEVTDTLAS